MRVDIPDKPVSLVIPTWNGRELLGRFLPSVVHALEKHPGGGEILVVDDGSQDGTFNFLSDNFPKVRALRLGDNSGFAAAVNRGVIEALHDRIVLLNNDVEAEENFIAPLVRWLEDPQVFGVCARSLDWDRVTFRDGGKVGEWKRGFWRVWRNFDRREDTAGTGIPLLSFYCPGGFSAFDRFKWFELGGLDELFSPFNWEDTDICYRALNRGWRLVYEPASIVYHKPSTTISGGAFRVRRVRYISRRNRLFFHWKNLTDTRFLAEHLFFLLLSLPLSVLRLDPVLPAAFIGALARLPRILERRAVEKERSTVSDSEIRELYREFIKNTQQIELK